MKLLFDFLPLVLFFGSFKYAEAHRDWAAAVANEHFGFLVSGGVLSGEEAPMLLATLVVIVATLAQVIFLKVRRQRVDGMLWASLALIVVLGGLTIWFRSETFIKWKPSVLYWIMGLTFWLWPLLFGKNLLRTMLGQQLQLPGLVWHRLNFAWIGFFATMGLLNLWVAYHFSTDTWVNFKLFGVLGMMVIFTVAQGLYLRRFLDNHDAPTTQGEP